MITLEVGGMTCAHCVAAVGAAVRGVDPGAEVVIDLAEGKVAVTGETSQSQLAAAIRAAGYTVAEGAA